MKSILALLALLPILLVTPARAETVHTEGQKPLEQKIGDTHFSIEKGEPTGAPIPEPAGSILLGLGALYFFIRKR